MTIEHDLPEFAELGALLRQGPSAVSDEAPPASLWAGIEAALEVEGAPVVQLAHRRLLRARRTAIAVAAVAAVGLIGVPLGLALRSASPDPVVADLAALEGFEGSGRAELTGRDLEVALQGLEPVKGEFYELWLLRLDGGELTDLKALGTIDDEGEFHIDDDVDLSKFNVVDVSLEPDDGNPKHSGVSVLRGELPRA